MKVKQIAGPSSDLSGRIMIEEKRGGNGSSLEFQRRLTTLSNANYEQYIRDLTDQISRQGEIVANRMDIGEFQKYRELITRLLNETVSNAYVFSKVDQFNFQGRHKVLALIRKINARLDQMASELLSQQSGNIRLLDMVDDIRGMLIDLYL